MKHSLFDAMISVLNAATSPLSVVISALDAAIPALGVVFFGARCGDIGDVVNIGACQGNIDSWCGVSSDFGDCKVGLTMQMCNRVTNP